MDELNKKLDKFERGTREQTLSDWTFKTFTATTVQKKLDGLSFNKAKLARLGVLTEELASSLIRNIERHEAPALHEKLKALAVSWGLSFKTVSGVKTDTEYELLAKIIAAAVLLAQ